MLDVFKIIGALGMLCICAGILRRRRKYQDEFYIAGGVLLEIYSLHIGDLLFIVLQIVFTLAAVDDFIKARYPRKGQ